MSFACPVCHAVSYNPNDEREGYCGNCHAFTGRPQDGQLRPSSSSAQAGQNRPMQLQTDNEEPQAEEGMREVQRDREGESMRGLRGERMELQGEQDLYKVSGARASVEKDNIYTMWIMMAALCGITVGLNVEELIVRKYGYGHESSGITAVMILAIASFQFGWVAYQHFRIRRWRQDLRAQRERLLNDFNKRIDEMFPNDPVGAARVKMRMEAEWPKP